MKKVIVLIALFASFALYSCSTDDSSDDEVVDSSGFDDTDDVYLSDFGYYKYPDYDIWIINDLTAETTDFLGLSAAITAATLEGRQIAIAFPKLISIPDYAFFGVEQGEVLYDEDYDYYYYDYDDWIDFSQYDASGVVSISANVAQSIGDYAFAFCTELYKVYFPEVTEIGDGAFLFSDVASLSDEQFPLLEELGALSFYGNSSLATVDLPLLTSIGGYCFSLCPELTSINASSVESIGEWAFSGCQLLEEMDLTDAQMIEASAFYGCNSLTSVSFPDATYIGKWAFSACTELAQVEIPSATYIGEQAFYICDALTSLEFLDATYVGSGAFYLCANLASIDLPLVESIGSEAFRSCKMLTSIELPSVSFIDNYLFYGCTSLTSITLPSATTIDTSAFYGCSTLSSLTLATEDSVVLESVAVNAFLECDTSAIALTLGSANSEFVEGNTLSVGAVFTGDFGSIALQ